MLLNLQLKGLLNRRTIQPSSTLLPVLLQVLLIVLVWISSLSRGVHLFCVQPITISGYLSLPLCLHSSSIILLTVFVHNLLRLMPFIVLFCFIFIRCSFFDFCLTVYWPRPQIHVSSLKHNPSTCAFSKRALYPWWDSQRTVLKPLAPWSLFTKCSSWQNFLYYRFNYMFLSTVTSSLILWPFVQFSHHYKCWSDSKLVLLSLLKKHCHTVDIWTLSPTSPPHEVNGFFCHQDPKWLSHHRPKTQQLYK